ncbi:MAG: tRNA pseudouridine(13) synthase TruD [gamma proteobacterium symbiont of Lucinoma myriamae]|nr:tRNA pseudouridine(13) synthase TruD [gamma proteobacterium symbiont of Lucinoma myriamae]MCU7818516.1 tRNA pseudouridine(13) synthase TruD [gamma proteobacterium symbiont of Lucinoma myriamae]MCU7832929.1 tRNA pseudouridine(13) synthase TruD [gamma proteobacterium symbiont of Lucinoma myriamae]
MSETENDLSRLYPVFKVEELAYVQNAPQGSAKFKTNTADFIVRETLSFEPEGEGTHAYLYIEKTNTNTEWLARQLARFVGVEAKEIGYAGLKDRNAVTSQWFSINLEITDEPDWDEFQLEGVKILKRTLHRKKLKNEPIKVCCFQRHVQWFLIRCCHKE